VITKTVEQPAAGNAVL